MRLILLAPLLLEVGNLEESRAALPCQLCIIKHMCIIALWAAEVDATPLTAEPCIGLHWSYRKDSSDLDIRRRLKLKSDEFFYTTL